MKPLRIASATPLTGDARGRSRAGRRASIFLAAALVFFAALGAAAPDNSRNASGIYAIQPAGPLISPQVSANPLLDGFSLQSSWKEIARPDGEPDWGCFERAWPMLTIGQRFAALTVVAEPRESGSGVEAAWEAFVAKFGGRLSSTTSVSLVAITWPGAAERTWKPASEDEIEEEAIRRDAALAARATRTFASAFPEARLALRMELPEGEAGARWLRAVAEAAMPGAKERLMIVASGVRGGKEWLEARRPAGEVLRSLHESVVAGIQFDGALFGRLPAPASGASQPSPESESAATDAALGKAGEPFRRAAAFGRWIGATHFELDPADLGNLSARADLLYLRSRLPGSSEPAASPTQP